MMKYFKIAYDMLINKFVLTLIITIEMAVFLILCNTVAGTYNSKNMLYEPYKDILKNNSGVVFMLDGTLNHDECDNAEIEKLRHDGYLDNEDVIDYLEKNLEGDAKIYYNSQLEFWEDDHMAPHSSLPMDEGELVDYILLDDEIFKKYRLPLAEGRWASSEKNSAGETEVVVSGGTDTKLNELYVTPAGKFRVVGILTDNTYEPPGSGYLSDDNNKEGLFSFYEAFDANVSMAGPFIIADRKLVDYKEDNYKKFNCTTEPVWFVSYGSGLDEESIKRNNDLLKTIGYFDDDKDFSTLSEDTENTINNIYIGMLPMIIAAAVVILSGLIGSAAMTAIRQMKTFGIFFLCGCRWRDCIKIISASLVIILGMSVVLAVLGIYGMWAMNFEYLIGLSFGWNNFVISVVILAVMYLLSIILPHNIIKSSSPVETIKEN